MGAVFNAAPMLQWHFDGPSVTLGGCCAGSTLRQHFTGATLPLNWYWDNIGAVLTLHYRYADATYRCLFTSIALALRCIAAALALPLH